jgi:hypothetical protein
MLFRAWKKYLWVSYILFICAVIIISYDYVYSMGKNMPVELVTLEGDESFIKDIRIQGFLGDPYVRFVLNFDNNHKQLKAVYGDNVSRLKVYNYLYGKSIIPLENSKTLSMLVHYDSVRNHANPRDFVQILKSNEAFTKTIESKFIGVPMSSSPISHGTSPRLAASMNMLRVMDYVDDKLYFILPSSEYSSGFSGIYEISEFDKGEPKIIFNNGREERLYSKSGYRKLIDIDLERGRVQVNGLFSDGDKLYVVFIEANKLLVRTFDLKVEDFIDEIILYENVESDSYLYYNLDYASLLENNLSIVMTQDKITRVITVNVKGDLKKVFDINITHNSYDSYSYENYTISRFGRFFDVIYENDLIFILDEQQYFGANSLRQKEYYLRLSAYDKNGYLKYLGKINTGVDDDNIVEAVDNPGLSEKYVDGPLSRRKYYDVRFK